MRDDRAEVGSSSFAVRRGRAALGLVLAALLAGSGLGGCARYTLIESSGGELSEGARLGVAIWSHGHRRAAERRALRGYLAGALAKRGFDVRMLNLELLLGEELEGRLYPEGSYSAGAALATGIRAGGRLEGAAEEVEALLERTEADDARARLDTLRGVAADLAEEGNIDYVLVLERFASFGFNVYVVGTKTQRVVHSLTLMGNEDGLRAALGVPDDGTLRPRGSTDTRGGKLLSLSSFIARRLASGG